MFLLLHFLPELFAVRINCEYKFISYPVIGLAYVCVTRNLNVTQPNDSIVKVSGDHQNRLNHNQVRALEIRAQICNFLPQRIKNFFPNLEMLRVVNSQLKVITQADLKPLSKLRVIQMNANSLNSLPNDLFNFNQDLVRVDFRSQKFKFIGYNIFEKLQQLATADFQFCGCVNFFAQNGRSGVEELKKEIRINCQQLDELINEIKDLKDKVELITISNQNAKIKSFDFENDPMFMKFEAKFSKLQSDNEKCLQTSEVLTENFFAVIKKVENVELALNLKHKQNCDLQDVVNQKCLLENEQFQRLKRESSFVDIECEKVEWAKAEENFESCNVKNLKVTQTEFTIRNTVVGHKKEIIKSQSIEELKAFNEQIMFLPLSIPEKMPNLKILSFIECGLVSVNTKALRNLEKLQTLSFSHNAIKEISGVFENLTALISVDLSHNRIEKIDDETLKNLVELSVIKLNDNLLITLTENSFASQKKLKFLFLQRNKLSSISSNLLEPLKKLEFIDLIYNDCVDLSASKETAITIKNLKIYFSENCST